MTSQDQFKQILKRLLEKSQLNQVNWRERLSDAPWPHTSFLVVISDDTEIEIDFRSPESEPDYVVASLLIKGTETISLNLDDGNEDYELLYGLYKEAQRSTMKWDEALKEVENALAGDGPVGR